MKFSRLCEGIEIKSRLNFRDIDVSGIATDTRSLKAGDCFIAIKGHAADGHDFVEEAVRGGASVLVVERPVASALPTMVVENSSLASALMARRFFGDPASHLVLAGVTGTNGKTSTAFLLRSILNGAQGPCGIIGTVGYGASDELVAAGNTTPGPVDLYRMMAGFLERGCRSVVMEVSSHAAVQGRITGLEFDAGVFTNATRDHLDYHGTFERYLEAKEKFICTLAERGRKKRAGTFVFNADDPNVARMSKRFAGPTISFGFSPSAQIRGEGLTADLKGTRFDLVIGSRRVHIALRLLGTFSAFNALAAAACAHALGVGFDDITAGLEKLSEVPGRFQVVTTGTGPTAIVDYAHTPDALEKLLNFCRELSPRSIITVFGCGGDRDRGKRPMMGAIAARLSTIVFVTDDNPRTEDPDRIVKEILDGVKQGTTAIHVIRDRRTAIRAAVRAAGSGDLIVIAGKGHENEQRYHNRRIPFSDAREVKEALEGREVEHQS